MNYSSLEEAYGTPFGQRGPITHERKDVKEAKPEFSSLEKRSEESVKKNQSLVDSVMKSLPLDESPVTENFYIETPAPVLRNQVRERFTEPAPSDDKLSRILRLIEQNRTGYERAATQDMALYVFTGVFFLFTLDTFVMLGKSMRPYRT
jgi:hypothetical protein